MRVPIIKIKKVEKVRVKDLLEITEKMETKIADVIGLRLAIVEVRVERVELDVAVKIAADGRRMKIAVPEDRDYEITTNVVEEPNRNVVKEDRCLSTREPCENGVLLCLSITPLARVLSYLNSFKHFIVVGIELNLRISVSILQITHKRIKVR